MIQEYISFPKYDKNPVNNLFYYYYYYIEAKKKRFIPILFLSSRCALSICLRDSAAGNRTILGPADSQIHGRRHFYNEKYPSGIFKYEALLSHLKVNL